MKKYLFTLLLLLLGWKMGWAGDVTLSGKLSGFKQNSLVRVLVYSDPFSQLKITLASTRADNNGNFTLSFKADHPFYAQLAVNLKKGELFLFPEGKYQVNVQNDTTGKGSVFDRRPLNLDIHAEDNGQTEALEKFNLMYNEFLNQHYRSVYQYHNQQVLSDFQGKVDSVFSKITHPYLKEYMRYSLAELKWGSRKYSVQVFANKYFAAFPVSYHNIQYAQLFVNFFQNYFAVQPASQVTTDNLADAIATGSLKTLDALFQKDSVLKNDARVRQLVEITILSKLFYKNVYQQNDIKLLLSKIGKLSPFLQNRSIAKNWLKKLTYLMPGTPAPEFNLPDFNGNELSAGHWKGKFVLLSFYHTDCPICLYQWDEVEKMQEKLGSDFVPVAIVKGEKTTQYLKRFEQENERFTYLFLGNDILLPEKFQVIGFPSYVLLNPDGTIAMAPAPMPQDNALQKISLYMQEYKKRKQK